jgi:hypothetical protein
VSALFAELWGESSRSVIFAGLTGGSIARWRGIENADSSSIEPRRVKFPDKYPESHSLVSAGAYPSPNPSVNADSRLPVQPTGNWRIIEFRKVKMRKLIEEVVAKPPMKSNGAQ